jgi:hypothetical protein
MDNSWQAVWREITDEFGRTINAELHRFTEALQRWLCKLFASFPRPGWREDFQRFVAAWNAQGLELDADDAQAIVDWIAVQEANVLRQQQVHAKPYRIPLPPIDLPPPTLEETLAALWDLGQQIMRDSRPKDWLDEAQRAVERADVPEPIKKEFLKWIAAQQEIALWWETMQKPGAGGRAQPPKAGVRLYVRLRVNDVEFPASFTVGHVTIVAYDPQAGLGTAFDGSGIGPNGETPFGQMKNVYKDPDIIYGEYGTMIETGKTSYMEELLALRLAYSRLKQIPIYNAALGPNSNTYAHQLLRIAGFPEPTVPGIATGWNYSGMYRYGGALFDWYGHPKPWPNILTPQDIQKQSRSHEQ